MVSRYPPEDPRSLSDQDRAFVADYLTHYNAKRAARNVGWTDAEPMKRPAIRAEIRRQLSDRFAANDITADRVLRELASIAFANVSDAMSLSTHDGFQMLRVLDSDLWPRELHAAVAGIEQDKDGVIRLKTRDKLKALEMLAKHLQILEGEEEKDKVHIVVVPERAAKEDGWQENAHKTREESERRMEETLGQGVTKKAKPKR
jgi:phage terminase small subunit